MVGALSVFIMGEAAAGVACCGCSSAGCRLQVAVHLMFDLLVKGPNYYYIFSLK